MMDSVRFSIIENDLSWEDPNDQEKYEISSESSGGGVQNSTSHHNIERNPSGRRFVNEIWNRNDIEISLRDYPNANDIIEIINTKEFKKIINCIRDLNVALLIASWLGLSSSVVHLLEACHADPNASDHGGRTPLHLSCFNGDPVITKILLKHGAPANRWDGTRKITPLHCAASIGSVECIQLLLRYGAQLNAGIEKRSALHYAVENNQIQCVRVLLTKGADPNTPQCYTETPLHVAAAFGHKECVKLLIDHGADVKSQYGKRKMTALHLAVEEDYSDCVKILLDAGAEIDGMNVDGQTPLHLACLAQCPENADLLIQRGANVNLTYKDGRTALHAAIVRESRDWECARLLLLAGVDVNKPDNYGYTPLHMAALNEFGTCAYLLVEFGADLTACTNGGISALSFIVRRTPEVIPKYLGKFDTSIKVNDNDIGDVDCEIKLDFKLLVPNSERGETELLLAFIEVGQKRVLKHPLCETFLFLKWRRIRKFFLFSLFFNALYVLLFTIFILSVYAKDCPNPVSLRSGIQPCAPRLHIKYVGVAVIILNFMMLGKEIFQMAHGFTSYIRYWENWVQWCIILSVFMSAVNAPLITEDLKYIPLWQHHVAAIVIFLMWVELMMIVGRFPIFGLYIQMFTKVAVNFSKFLLAYSCLIIAFGLSFSVLFSNIPAFKTPPLSLLKTMIMMVGELEFDDIFHDNYVIYYPVTSHIIFLAFVVLVTVILANLLVGLAVSDIQGLQASAGLDRLTRQAQLVSRLEGMFYSKILAKFPSRILRFCQKNALLRTSRCKLQFCVKPNDPREKRLPKEMILSIYKLVAERRDRNQSLRKKKRKMNYSFFKRTVSEKDKDNHIQLRKQSTQHLRYRTLSDHPQHATLKPSVDDIRSSFPIENLPRNENEIVNDLIINIESSRDLILEKMDEISKSLTNLKKKLQQ